MIKSYFLKDGKVLEHVSDAVSVDNMMYAKAYHRLPCVQVTHYADFKRVRSGYFTYLGWRGVGGIERAPKKLRAMLMIMGVEL